MKPESPSLSVTAVCGLPILFGALVVAIAGLVTQVWDLRTAMIGKDVVLAGLEATRTTDAQFMARYGVAASFLFFLLAGLAALVLSWRQMWVSFDKGETVRLFGSQANARIVALVAALVFGFVLYGFVESSSAELRETLMPQVFDLTLKTCAASGCVAEGAEVKGKAFLAMLDENVSLGNLISSFVSAFVVVAACCFVVRARNLERTSEEALHAAFAELARRWKTLLYFASVFLVSGIIEISAWRSWPAAYLKDGSAAKSAFQAVVDGTVLMEGLMFTVVLFAIFFSAASLMNDAYLDRGGGKAGDAASALNLKGFGDLLTVKEISKSGLAILSPLISGIVPLAVDLIAATQGVP